MKVTLLNNFKPFTVDAELSTDVELMKFYHPLYGGICQHQHTPYPEAWLSFQLGNEFVKIDVCNLLMADNKAIRIFNKGTDGKSTVSLEYMKVDGVRIDLVNNTIQFFYRSLKCDRNGELLSSDLPLRYRPVAVFSGSIYPIIEDCNKVLCVNPFNKGFIVSF